MDAGIGDWSKELAVCCLKDPAVLHSLLPLLANSNSRQVDGVLTVQPHIHVEMSLWPCLSRCLLPMCLSVFCLSVKDITGQRMNALNNEFIQPVCRSVCLSVRPSVRLSVSVTVTDAISQTGR